MDPALNVATVAFALLGFAGIGWFIWRLLRNSYDAKDLLARWSISLGLVVGGYFAIDWIIGPNGGPIEKGLGVFLAVAIAMVLAMLWAPKIADTLTELIGSLWTGGNAPPKPEAYYSVALAKRQQGKFREALQEVRAQLARFPTDVTGQMLLARIQSEDLNDLPGARLAIERLLNQSGHSPPQIANALNSLADWHLKLQDRDEAASCLEQIITRLPDTDQARQAQQRLAHLATKETLLASHEHRPIELRAGVRDIGLLRHPAPVGMPEADPANTTRQLVAQLEAHPHDNEAREKLALLYAQHYQRLDLATRELEELIGAPHQPAKEVVRWLNLLADLQVSHGADPGIIRATLQRIIDLSPDLAAAQLARQRLDLLRLELKGKDKGQVLKLGTYEKDLGLKTSRQQKSQP